MELLVYWEMNLTKELDLVQEKRELDMVGGEEVGSGGLGAGI